MEYAMMTRLLGVVEQFWRHGPEAETLRALGWQELWSAADGREVHGTGPSGIRTAFTAGLDPIGLAVCLAMGQLGMLWPYVLPDYLPTLNRQWKAWRRAPTTEG